MPSDQTGRAIDAPSRIQRGRPFTTGCDCMQFVTVVETMTKTSWAESATFPLAVPQMI